MKSLRCYIINQAHYHQEVKPVAVVSGQARFTLDMGSYLTLVSQ